MPHGYLASPLACPRLPPLRTVRIFTFFAAAFMFNAWMHKSADTDVKQLMTTGMVGGLGGGEGGAGRDTGVSRWRAGQSGTLQGKAGRHACMLAARLRRAGKGHDLPVLAVARTLHSW